LVTAPEWRRRGAAAALISWGVDQARREGVVATVESTPAGKPQYEKQGFVQVGDLENEVEGVTLFTMMVCEPAKFEIH
jgi:GNAT superfamily N-acetyltransferase